MKQRGIVLDTSILLGLFEYNVNLGALLEACGGGELIVPSGVMDELSALSHRNARAAHALASTLNILHTEAAGDDCVLEAMASADAYAVATNDKGLAERVINRGGRVLILTKDRRFRFYKAGEI